MEGRRCVEDEEDMAPCGAVAAYCSETGGTGCPDEEVLCGWVDGHLRQSNLKAWLCAWLHLKMRRCRRCLAEILTLRNALTTNVESEVEDPDRRPPR
jgi:hypothetical protein